MPDKICNFFRSMLNKKASLGAEEIVIIILVILVLISALLLIFNSNILEKIKNLPGGNSPQDITKDLTCAEMKILSYSKIGKVIYEERSGDFVNHYYIYFESTTPKTESDCLKEYWRKNACVVNDCEVYFDKSKDLCDGLKGSLQDACIDSNGNFLVNTKETPTSIYWNWKSGEPGYGGLNVGLWGNIGRIENYFFMLDWRKDFSKLYKQGITQDMLVNLDGAKYVGGGIYRFNTKASLGEATYGENNLVTSASNGATSKILPIVELSIYGLNRYIISTTPSTMAYFYFKKLGNYIELYEYISEAENKAIGLFGFNGKLYVYVDSSLKDYAFVNVEYEKSVEIDNKIVKGTNIVLNYEEINRKLSP